MNKKLKKSSTDKALVKICGGNAEYFDISSSGVKPIFVFLPANLIIYLILAATLPNGPPSL